MKLLAAALVAFVAFQHVIFLVLEMFLWRRPSGRKIFGSTPEFAEASAALAANQGLYNGFLAAGLVFGLLAQDPGEAFRIQAFFLACVVVAGVFGAATAKWTILLVQAVPALAALGAVWAAR